MDFVGRQYEIDYLDRLLSSPKGEFCVIYGRRRIGKTTLLTHWLKKYEDRGTYWLAVDLNEKALLRSLSQVIYRFIRGQAPRRPTLPITTGKPSFRSWSIFCRGKVKNKSSSWTSLPTPSMPPPTCRSSCRRCGITISKSCPFC